MKTYLVFFNYDTWTSGAFSKRIERQGSILYSCEQLSDDDITEINRRISEHHTAYHITKMEMINT